MTDLSQLTLDFAVQYPQAFADHLAVGEPSEVKSVLDQLPAAALMPVLAHLPAGRLQDVSAEMFRQISATLTLSDIDHTAAYLVRQPVAERGGLIALVTDRTLRRRVRQRMNYATHTVGSLIVEADLLISADAEIAELLSDLRARKTKREESVIILDEDGRYVGVLDVWKTLITAEPQGPARNFALRLPALAAEMSLQAAQSVPEWRWAQWLPVIDFDGRCLGKVHQDVLLMHEIPADDPAELMASSVANLMTQFFVVLSSAMSRLLAVQDSR